MCRSAWNFNARRSSASVRSRPRANRTRGARASTIAPGPQATSRARSVGCGFVKATCSARISGVSRWAKTENASAVFVNCFCTVSLCFLDMSCRGSFVPGPLSLVPMLLSSSFLVGREGCELPVPRRTKNESSAQSSRRSHRSHGEDEEQGASFLVLGFISTATLFPDPSPVASRRPLPKREGCKIKRNCPLPWGEGGAKRRVRGHVTCYGTNEIEHLASFSVQPQ